MTAPLVQAVYPRKTSRGWRVTLVGWNLDMVLAVRLGSLDLIEPSQKTARELVVSIPSTATAGSYPLSLTGLFGELQVSTISVVELVDLDLACPRPYGAEEYTAQAQELLPKGQAWTRRVGTNLWKLLAACSEESARIHQRACDLLMETTPSQSLDSIPDWETELGLPEKCVENLAPSLDARRLEIFRKFNSTGGQAAQYYEDLAALLGYKARVEEVYETASPFKAGKSKAGDKLTQGPWLFAWRVVVQIPESNVQSFKAGQNKAGDPLRWWGFQELECFLETLKPSHTILLFSYVSSNMLLRIAEAEVSMLTIDGSDGKGNEFILTAVSDDGQPMYGITWISQDTSIATVTSNGDGLTATVRGVGIGAASLGADVLIYASHNGIVKECLFTIYNTLPSADVEGAGLWAIKGGQGDGIEVYFRSYNVPIEPLTYVYVDYSAMYTQNENHNSAFRPISSTSFNHPVIIYDGGALRYAKRIATVNGASYTYSDYKTSYVIPLSIETRNKILIDSKMFINDVQQNLQFLNTSPELTTPNNAVIIFDGTQKKIITAIASNASINMSDLTSPLMSYICQNFVKFTDYDSYVNRTRILNMGTLGPSCDMEANNVPETWFNI